MRISDWSSDVCSSDLRSQGACTFQVRSRRGEWGRKIGLPGSLRSGGDQTWHVSRRRQVDRAAIGPAAFAGRIGESDLEDQRSEEHTSELQSLMRISYAVFCLKKKKRKQTYSQQKYSRRA